MKSMFRIVSMMFLASVVSSMPVRAEKQSGQNYSAYLFVHFTGETPLGEQLYFTVSTNGLDWTDLNNSAPVLTSDLGEKGVRDPSIIRSADGKKFYILATDLRIANGRGWDAARFEGSHSLIFWESEDLINWSEPWSVKVSGAVPDAGCTWAPEAIYDATTGDYVVYWAIIATKDGVKEARIYTARTKDFRSFTPAELYIERVGEGVNAKDIIDTQIIEVQGGEYKYYRVSRDSQITVEAADSIFGDWTRIGDISHLGYTADDVEGPILFQFNNEQKWCLLVDRYATSGGYLPLVTTDLSDPSAFRVLGDDEYSLGANLKRHGGILNITQAEYDALVQKWPSTPVCRIESIGDSGHYLRHSNYTARLDANVWPAQDSEWHIVPGLAGKESVSFEAINFPGFFVVAKGDGFVLEINDGSDSFATRASFLKVPGLADAAAVSFQIVGEENRYLLNRNSVLTAGPVSTEEEKASATFRIVESK